MVNKMILSPSIYLHDKLFRKKGQGDLQLEIVYTILVIILLWIKWKIDNSEQTLYLMGKHNAAPELHYVSFS